MTTKKYIPTSPSGQPYRLIARKLHEKGYEPIPLVPVSKRPSIKNWRSVDCGELVKRWPKNYGIGLRTGNLIAIDIDIYCEKTVKTLLSYIDFTYIKRVGQPPKVLLPVLCKGIQKKILSDRYVDEHGEFHRIEILSKGQFFVSYGIHEDTKRPYTWSEDFLCHNPPELTVGEVMQVIDIFNELACNNGWTNLSRKEENAEKKVANRTPQDQGNAPGSRFNRAFDIKDVLTRYGWKHFRGRYWTRPGKKSGASATLIDNKVLFPFTTNSELEVEKPADAFEIMARYDFGGDKSAAAKAILGGIYG